MERVAAAPVSAHCKATQDFHPSQCGCGASRSAVDAVGVAFAPYPGGLETRQSHGGPPHGCRGGFPQRGQRIPALKDAKHGARRKPGQVDGQLHARLEGHNKCGWSGRRSPRYTVTTGLPQGSPISPVLFATHIADTSQAVKDEVDSSRGISFVGGVTWLMEGDRHQGGHLATRAMRSSQPRVGR